MSPHRHGSNPPYLITEHQHHRNAHLAGQRSWHFGNPVLAIINVTALSASNEELSHAALVLTHVPPPIVLHLHSRSHSRPSRRFEGMPATFHFYSRTAETREDCACVSPRVAVFIPPWICWRYLLECAFIPSFISPHLIGVVAAPK